LLLESVLLTEFLESLEIQEGANLVAGLDEFLEQDQMVDPLLHH
jgi:hypothetical protein